MHLRSVVILVAATLATASAVAGCSGKTDNTGSTGQNTAPAATSAANSSDQSTSTSSAATSAATTGSVNFTAQGTKLAIGTKAVVPFGSSGKTGAIGITVTGIDKGDPADLTPLKLGDQVKGMAPFYVRVTVTNESGTDFSYTSMGLLSGALADGRDASKVAVFSTFDKCPNGQGDANFTTKGASYTTCVLAVADPSTPVVGASYEDTEYSKQAPNTDYGSAPITWK